MFSSLFLETRHLAAFQGPRRIQIAIKMDELGHEPGPAGLMAGAQSRPVVAVEIFVKEDVIAPMGIGLELLCAAVYRTPAALIAQEDPSEPVGDLLAHLEEVHHLSRPCGAFDLEVVAVV